MAYLQKSNVKMSSDYYYVFVRFARFLDHNLFLEEWGYWLMKVEFQAFFVFQHFMNISSSVKLNFYIKWNGVLLVGWVSNVISWTKLHSFSERKSGLPENILLSFD